MLPSRKWDRYMGICPNTRTGAGDEAKMERDELGAVNLSSIEGNQMRSHC